MPTTIRRRLQNWIDKKRGAAPTKTPKEISVQSPEVSSPESPTFGTFASAVTEAVENEELISRQSTTTSAEPTSKNGLSNTVWMTNLQKLAEEPWEELEGLDLSALPTHLQGKLLLLADGRNEPVAAVIHQICQYLSEEEAPYCEGPLIDGVVFFLENEIQ